MSECIHDWPKGGIKINLHTVNQCVKSRDKVGIHGLQALLVVRDILGKEAQELPKQRVVTLGGLGGD